MWRLHAQDESLGSQLLSTVLSIAAWSKCSLGSAPARLLQLLRVRLAALGSSACPGLGLATASQLLEPAASKVAHAFDHSGNDVQQAEAIFGSVAAAQSMRLANAIDWRGKSVLMHAASRDHAGMVELLVRHKVATLGGKQGGSALGQLALRSLLSAPDRAPGCPELRPASSANEPLGLRWPAPRPDLC